MKKLGIIFATIVMLMLFVVSASALDASGRCGKDANYTFDSTTGELVITGTGAIAAEAFYDKDEIKTVIIGDGITEIGTDAFNNANNITSVSIGKDVITIGSRGFYGCYSLTNINFPDGLTTIGSSAFYCCNGLTIVSIPDSVTETGSETFRACAALKSVKIGKGIKTITGAMFYYCTDLESVIISDGVTTIGVEAFYKCSNLESISIPKSIKLIGWQAFDYCSSLFDVYYASSESDWNLISIGSNNTGLSNATIHFNDAGHTHTWSDWAEVTAPTCTSFGSAERSCVSCKETQTQSVNKLDHTLGEWIVTQTVTCESDGYKYAVCTVCNTKKEEVTPATGHNIQGTTIEPTCTIAGVKVGYCTNCQTTTTEEIPALGHTEVIIEGYPATCESIGLTDSSYCEVCGVAIVVPQAIPTLEHNYQANWQTLNAPTCSDNGLAIKICKDCFSITKETLPATGHTDVNADNYCDSCGMQIDFIEDVTEDLGIIEKLIAWFKDIINKLFGWLKF